MAGLNVVISVFLSFKARLFVTATIIYFHTCDRTVYFRANTQAHATHARCPVSQHASITMFYCSYLFCFDVIIKKKKKKHNLKRRINIIIYNVTLIARFLSLLLFDRVGNVRNVSLNREIQHKFKMFRGVQSTLKNQTTIRNIENVLNY